MSRILLTTTIPYVNARPHLGFALELVQVDVLARHHRLLGDEVRFQTGTDDNSLKNVRAAEAEGIAVRDLVDRNAAEFARLAGPLSLSYDDFIRTSADPRHRPGVERFWRACSADLYRRHYEGLYCVGCEQFYPSDEQCPEHDAPLQRVSEENWFFRLSRYRDELYGLIDSGRIRVEPAERRNEILAFIAAGLSDFSVSRSQARARGWGIPVPGDPGQVIYVWWDALGNYLTALDYAKGEHDDWWSGADRRIHVLGKGVLRFHAVYWPAMLLSAGEVPPTDILVHDYLTVDGRKISKSALSGGPGHSGDGPTGTELSAVDPIGLVEAYGVDAVRWWLLREVPRVGDVDFTARRLIARHDGELADGLGNLVNRVVSMVHRYRGGIVPEERETALDEVRGKARGAVHEALEAFDFRAATAAVYAVAEEANRYVNRTEPWRLAREGSPRLDAVLGTLVATCRELADLLAPFLPDASARIAGQCRGERLADPVPLFPHHRPRGPAPARVEQRLTSSVPSPHSDTVPARRSGG
ncbi:methionine--tRNA ligase [Streptosporangium amethystogenes subsp. fukuiense]|uniref:methionine--tRNA ligase n=1 Tax=Streptosporangium amethystogenes subsp. fukuiense TaxID=698418 RepID=A0ABW2T115_9ACTN